MKWIIALLVSAAMFYMGYHHASRYETDETTKPSEAQAGGNSSESGEPSEPAS